MAYDKAAADKKINARPEQVQKRVECNKANAENPDSVKGDGLDASHEGGKIVWRKASVNRGSRKDNGRIPGKKHRTKAIVKSLTA